MTISVPQSKHSKKDEAPCFAHVSMPSSEGRLSYNVDRSSAALPPCCNNPACRIHLSQSSCDCSEADSERKHASCDDEKETLKLVGKSERIGIDTLLAEARDMLRGNSQLPPGQTLLIDYTEKKIIATFQGTALADTPFAQSVLNLHVRATPGYPIQPPEAWFSKRLLHLNFTLALDGTTHLTQLLKTWQPTWNLATFLKHTYELLRMPNADLLPPDLPLARIEQIRSIDARQWILSPPGLDLRRVNGASHAFLAELKYLYVHSHAEYDALSRNFAEKYLDRHLANTTHSTRNERAPIEEGRGSNSYHV